MRGRKNSLFVVARMSLLALALAACGSSDNAPRNPAGAGPAPVDLGGPADLAGAADYVILAKATITNTGTSAITGDLGLSPAAASYLVGFTLTLPPGSASSTSPLVTGKLYASDYASPTPTNLTTAIGKMQTAYTDAAGRTSPDKTELAAGNLSGLTLAPGLYKWSSNVTIPTDLTIAGTASDVWIFQVAGDLNLSSAKKVILSGGATAKNIFWQVAGLTTLETTSHFEGTILCKTQITLKTGASLNGRVLAQTQVALDSNTITRP